MHVCKFILVGVIILVGESILVTSYCLAFNLLWHERKTAAWLTKQQLSYLQREQVVFNLLTDTDEFYCPTAIELHEYRVPKSAAASPIPPTPSFTGSLTSPLPHIDTFLNTDLSQVIPDTQGYLSRVLPSHARVTFLVWLVNFLPCAFV